jgi:transcriptional regulator with XRE-family HTH domain
LFRSLLRGRVMPKTIFTGANQVVVTALREAREMAGLTQAEVGRRIGKDQSHISLIEASQRRLDLVEFHELARALGRDPIDLFAEISARLP